MKYFASPLLKSQLFRGTASAAIICDTLLLLPFFFTSNLFVKILPSGNVWSLTVLLIFSVFSLSLSKYYERLRTAGLLKIQSRTLAHFRNVEVSLLFSGQPQGGNQQFLLSVLISLKTNEFLAAATGAFQIFFPIIILIITLFISVPLFILLIVFLIIYGYVFSAVQVSRNTVSDNKLNLQALLKRMSFYYWMGRGKVGSLLNNRRSAAMPYVRQMLDASEMGNFRYSASLILLAACAFLIIEESLPVGYLLPISFFSQRLLVPAEKYKQVKMIWSVFKIFATHETLSKSTSTVVVVNDEEGIDGIALATPLLHQEVRGDFSLALNQNVQVRNGQLMVITGGAGFGKSKLLDLVLGLVTLKSGRIHLSSKSKTPWEFIRYFDQRDVFFKPDSSLSFYSERILQFDDFFANSQRHVLVIDDPFLGADAKTRDKLLMMMAQALQVGAILVCACNDKQLVEMSSVWLAIAPNGEVAVRKGGEAA
jgi:ABC-type transport system involved in cytochrome c biogenesis ATPase subunit